MNREASARGGRVSASKLTPEERVARARKAAGARWGGEKREGDWREGLEAVRLAVIKRYGAGTHLLRQVENLHQSLEGC
jgi:hypothetical protein